jgi:DNA gyrase/topoisomerase IV subunit A
MTPEELREHRRSIAEHRLSIVEALLRAIDLGWPVLETIENSPDRSEARRRLTDTPFSFDEVQAEHVLDMQHGRRTEEGRRSLSEEMSDLKRLLSES